jgi:hypothetical protein
MTGRVGAVMLGLLALAALTISSGAASAATPDQSPAEMSVTLDQNSVAVGTGQGFEFRSTITNLTGQPLTSVIAHLNIVSTNGDVYVDPEDWSSDRSQYVDTLPAGATHELTWNVRAVTTGELILYVAVTTSSGGTNVVASQPLHATVTATRTIDAAGVLPIALGVPAALVICLGAAVRRRRQLA